MKKHLLVFQVFIILIAIVSCKSKVSTSEDVKKFVEEKGTNVVTWSDFEHLEHENIGKELIVELYNLKDGNILRLVGPSYERRPRWIVIQDDKGNILEELK